MKRFTHALLLPLLFAVCAIGAGGLLTSCGFLSAFGGAARESSQLEQRYSALDEKLKQVDDAIRAYGPLAEDLGPEVKKQYEQILDQYSKVQGYVSEGKELLGQAVSLHEQSLKQATDPNTGETDWIKYALLMLAGGGGLYSERRKTSKEKEVLHERVSKRKEEVQDLQLQLEKLRSMMEIEQARRAQPSA